MLKEQEKEHWVFSFDLKVDDIKTFYKGSAYNHAYDEICNFLFKNGFNNGKMKEGSVYITAEPTLIILQTQIVNLRCIRIIRTQCVSGD